MGFSPDYLYYFHYSDSMGYLIFCRRTVASIFTIIWTNGEFINLSSPKKQLTFATL